MEIAGLVLGILGLLAAFAAFVPRIRDYWDRKHHVRDVRARLEPIWQLEEASTSSRSKVLTGVKLVVSNSGRWPVREVMTLEPASAATEGRAELAAGETWQMDLPLHQAQAEYEQPVVLQLIDVRGRCWCWTPVLNELVPIPTPIPLHARFIQWTARRFWPHSVHEAFTRLPKRAQRALWGYDPEG